MRRGDPAYAAGMHVRASASCKTSGASHGGVAERPKATPLQGGALCSLVGSNPTAASDAERGPVWGPVLTPPGG